MPLVTGELVSRGATTGCRTTEVAPPPPHPPPEVDHEVIEIFVRHVVSTEVIHPDVILTDAVLVPTVV